MAAKAARARSREVPGEASETMIPRWPGRGHSACLERSGPPHYNGDMIDAIITFSIRHRALVIGAGLALALLGRLRRWETPVDAIPDLSENQVIVFTAWKGHGPREIEDQVTYPLSLGLAGLRGVRVVRSSSDVGFSMISVIFEEGISSAEGRRRVADRLARVQAELPEDARAGAGAGRAGDRADLLVHGRGGGARPGPAAGDPGLVRSAADRRRSRAWPRWRAWAGFPSSTRSRPTCDRLRLAG